MLCVLQWDTSQHFSQFKCLTCVLSIREINHPLLPENSPKSSSNTVGWEDNTGMTGCRHVCVSCQQGPTLAKVGCNLSLLLHTSKAALPLCKHWPSAFRSNASHAPQPFTHTECNTCQGCILGSHACHLIRSIFNFILSFIWWNASRGPNHLHVTNTNLTPLFWLLLTSVSG